MLMGEISEGVGLRKLFQLGATASRWNIKYVGTILT